MNTKQPFQIKGKYRIRSFKAGTKELVWEGPWIENLVVSSDGYGRNLIMRQLMGDATYGMEIDSAAIGTGTSAPTDADTGLGVSVLSGIVPSLQEISNDVGIVSFFIPDGDLADGTYTEFGVFIGGRLFARSLITPNYSKASGNDTSVDYTFDLSSA